MAKNKANWKVCDKCKQEIKPIRIDIGKKRFGWYCDCGIFEKDGKKIN